MKGLSSENQECGPGIKTHGCQDCDNQAFVGLSRDADPSNENWEVVEKIVMDPLTHVLIDSSAKYANDSKVGEPHGKPETSQVDLLPKVKIFQATGCSERNDTVRRQYPDEVVIQSRGSNGRPSAASTVYSELPVEGMLSIATDERRFPKRFTFDVVASKSSLDESEIRFDAIMAHRSPCFQNISTTENSIHGLEYEIDDLSDPVTEAENDNKIVGGIIDVTTLVPSDCEGDAKKLPSSSPPPLGQPDGPNCDQASHSPDQTEIDDGCDRKRERCPTEGTEMSIELSESDFLRSTTTKSVDQKYEVFSPQHSTTKAPIEHGFDVAQAYHAEKKEEVVAVILPWLKFGFFSFW